MMKIETIEVSGFAGALSALRLPYGLPARSEMNITMDRRGNCWSSRQDIAIDQRDIDLLMKLRKRGDEHAKVLRGITVTAEITAPIYWWCEEETYRVGHERLASESTMHMECRGLGGEELQRAKSDIPMGHELKKVDTFSYQCLCRIMAQRHNHRLPEWHQFCDWVKTLPFADELILPMPLEIVPEQKLTGTGV